MNASPYAAYIKNVIEENKIVIFSKTYCPYSNMAKDVFRKLSVTPKVIELDSHIDGENILKELGEMTGAKTVPRVFINGKFIGGGEDCRRMFEDGRLKKYLDTGDLNQ